MTALFPQIFVLMLAAFLLGAVLACVARALLSEKPATEPVLAKLTPSAGERRPQPAAGASSPAVDRFARALSSAGAMPEAAPAAVQAATPAPKPQPETASAPRTSPPPAAATAPSRSAEPAEPPKAAAPAVPPIAPTAPEPAPKPAAVPAPSTPPPAAAIAPSRPAEPPKPAEPPPAAEPPKAAAPAVPPKPAAAPIAFDDLTRVRGIDPAAAATLIRLGITKFDQIARWRPDDVARANRELGAPGRAEQQNWIEQAAILAKGGQTAFARDGGSPAPSAPPAAGTPAASRNNLAGLRSVRSGAVASNVPAASPDDLKRIRGIGVLIEKRLNALGIASFEQIANWTGADIGRVGQALEIENRIDRENWVEQARILASGGQTAFSRRTP